MRIAVLAVALLSVGAHGGVYTGIETDVSALPKKKAFIGRLVRSRVWDRMMPSTFNKKADLKVMFVIDESLGGENAAVKVANGRAEVRGARFRALVAGAGVMMRAMRFCGKGFELADGEYRFSPAKPFRQVYFARHFENWYHRASTELIVRYFEDLMLWVCFEKFTSIAHSITKPQLLFSAKALSCLMFLRIDTLPFSADFQI